MGKREAWYCDRCKEDVKAPTDLFTVKVAEVERLQVKMINKDVCRTCVLELSDAYNEGEVES